MSNNYSTQIEMSCRAQVDAMAARTEEAFGISRLLAMSRPLSMIVLRR